jgi:hypothetical protein
VPIGDISAIGLFYFGHDRLIFSFDPDDNCLRCFVGGIPSKMVGVWWCIDNLAILHDLRANTLDLKGLLALDYVDELVPFFMLMQG